ncbi:hypothetical protein HK097_010066 [Rhizophlyctis rosea]|uniref:Uncharacterized protein n=1 Tax=Rhizophlyctis rosea TaxID=64517 RepID=A0AAD5S9N8_9FUNG|nr:hypothetical protein HK097_010066 [Rhizophlyctis rosea]
MIEAKRMSDYIRMVSLHDRCSTTEERAVVETQALALGVTAFVQEGLTKQQIREEAEVIITIQQNLEDHLVSGVTPAPASSKRRN